MTESDTSVSFNSLSFDERVVEVENRIGDQPDRIKSPFDLLKLKGQRIFCVVSPFGNEEADIGTCFMVEWTVGEIKDQYGIPLEQVNDIDLSAKKKYICWSATEPKHGLSIRDFNIIPNNFNNHCAFTDKDSAESYMFFRKLQFTVDLALDQASEKYPYYVTIEDVAKMLEIEQQMDGGN